MGLVALNHAGLVTFFPGTVLAGDTIPHPSSEVGVAANPLTVFPATPEEVEDFGFKLPDLYLYYPEVVRRQDTNLVPRADVPLYAWDSVPVWDMAPYQWDQVIGPEPILKTTTRVMQLELQKSAQEICRFTEIFDARKTDRENLPYLSALLGTPLPSANESNQRVFLQRLMDTYRNKGTPLSFVRLFESLGFEVVLQEQYQRRLDAAFVTGPQMALVSTDIVLGEPVGTTIASAGPYTFQFLNKPIARGSIRLKVFDQSENIPTVIADDGEGSWSDGLVGSVDYVTGSASVTLAGVPALIGQPIEADYRYLVDPFPDPREIRFTDRLRSSFVGLSLTPKDPSLSLTDEINQRLALYLGLLKPAHVVISSLDIVFKFDENENPNLDDVLDIRPAWMTVDSLFGTLYRGLGYNGTDNGSLHTNPAFLGFQHRTAGEFVRDPVADPNQEGPPYVYPFFRDGKFHTPNAAEDFEAFWDNIYDVFTGTVTADIAQTTTTFSITTGVPGSLGAGDICTLDDGPAGGEQSTMTSLTDNTTFFTVVMDVALPVAPEVGDAISLLQIESPQRNGLVDRAQEDLDLLFGEDLSPAPDSVDLGPFTVTLANTPVSGTARLRFTVAAATFEETATGTGAFTNTSTHLASSNIDFTTGAVTVTFDTGDAPDTGTELAVYAGIAASLGLGDF